jgi:hypothetical protein
MHSAHTFLGLHFTNTVDPAALVTLVLATAAIIGLILTRRSLNQTQEEIALSRKEVQEAHRPVVVPVLIPRAPETASTRSSRHTLPCRPSVVDAGVLAVPLQNIGSGPALNVEASMTRVEDDGSPFPGPSERQTPGSVTGICKGTSPRRDLAHCGSHQRQFLRRYRRVCLRSSSDRSARHRLAPAIPGKHRATPTDGFAAPRKRTPRLAPTQATHPLRLSLRCCCLWGL